MKISKIQKIDLPKIPRFHAHAKLVKNMQCFFKNIFSLYVLRIWGFQRFIKIPHSYFSVFMQSDRDWRLFWTHQVINFSFCGPQAFQFFQTLIVSIFVDPKLPKFHFMFSGRYCILPKFHSCFLVDIDPISKIFKMCLDGSSSFVSARLF